MAVLVSICSPGFDFVARALNEVVMADSLSGTRFATFASMGPIEAAKPATPSRMLARTLFGSAPSAFGE